LIFIGVFGTCKNLSPIKHLHLHIVEAVIISQSLFSSGIIVKAKVRLLQSVTNA